MTDSDKPRRVLLKLSGEAFGGGKVGIDTHVIRRIAEEIVPAVQQGVQVAIVVGGGNFFRGAELQQAGIDRSRGDYMGMLGTVMNCLALQDFLEQEGQATRVQTAITMGQVAEPYIPLKAIRHLEKGRVVIFGAGAGMPYFSTDTVSIQRSLEIHCDEVLMGIGEPLDNFDEVMRFLENISSPEGVNIGMRNISLSTCGLVPKIDMLAGKKLQLTLSVSLHAPDNDIRSGMMPVNDAYPVEVLMQAVRRYQETTGRRVSFEYSMVRGVNDSDACAKQLAGLIRGMGAHVNLIPINPVDGSPYSATDAANVRRFQQKLESLGVNATVRRRLGSEISAACGQLRRDEMNGKA